MSGLGTWLRAGGATRVSTVLRHRPDAARPAPRTLGELAGRLAEPASVADVLHHLDLPCIEVLDALRLLGDGAAPAQLAGLLAGDPSEALQRLADHALVWPDGSGRLRLAGPLRNAEGAPHRLGRPLRPLLSCYTVEQLRLLAQRTGLAAAGRKSELVDALHAHLTDPTRVAAQVAAAPLPARRLLEELTWKAPSIAPAFRADYRGVAFGPHEQRWLMERGLVVASDYVTAELPREIGLVLRGPGYRLPLTPPPPQPATAPVEPAVVAEAAGAAGLAAVAAVTQLVATLAAAPLAQLSGGGVGIRELKRVAKLLQLDLPAVRLWLELAAAAGLVVTAGAEVLPTAASDEWQRADPGRRLVPLLTAWWRCTEVPTAPVVEEAGRTPPALAPRWQPRPAVQLRRDVLASLATDRGLLDPAHLWAALAWRRPLAYPDLDELTTRGTATLAEAELLGVAARGAGSALGEALREGDEARLAAAATALLPKPLTTAALLPDLTAVVAGTPSTELAALLDRTADRETRDTASTWRFSPASLRRAFDAGVSAEALLAELADAADGPLPQPLTYLVRDAARGHGRLQVVTLGCAVTSDDPVLLAEAVRHKGLREARLRPLAPTVLAAGTPVARTLELLRASGYAPVELGPDGGVRLRRTPRRRGPTPSRVPPQRSGRTPAAVPVTDAELAALAEALLASDTPRSNPDPPHPDLVERGQRPSLTAEHIRRHTARLSAVEVAALAAAVDDGTPVVIDYIDTGGAATRRTVEPTVFRPPMLVAWCYLRDDERDFLLDRILAVHPA